MGLNRIDMSKYFDAEMSIKNKTKSEKIILHANFITTIQK